MTLLLDTHALLWWLSDDPLEPAARTRIADPGELVRVSAVSLWEIAIKRAIGKLQVEGSLASHVHHSGFEPCRSPGTMASGLGGSPFTTATPSTACWWRRPRPSPSPW